jgi:hypothetical protein
MILGGIINADCGPWYELQKRKGIPEEGQGDDRDDAERYSPHSNFKDTAMFWVGTKRYA